MLNFENLWAFSIILIYFFALKFCKEKRQSLYFSNVKMLKIACKNRDFLIKLLKFLTILCFSIALASPIKLTNSSNIKAKAHEIVLMLDMSGSMQSFNRFNIVKKILTDFIDKRKDDAIGLSIFGDFAYVVSPLTYDKKSIKKSLEILKIGMAGTKTALYEGLFLSANLFKNSASKNKVIILPTDGENTINSVPLEVAINVAKEHNIKVYTIGIGKISDLSKRNLRQIAKETGGKYFSSYTKSDLEKIYLDIDKFEKSDINLQKYFEKQYFFEWFLGAGMLSLVMLFFAKNLRFCRC